MSDSSVFLIECPKFLGGTRSVKHMARAECDLESLCIDADSIRGIRFTGAPRESDGIWAAGDWKVHIDAWDFDLLADAYLHLEDVAISSDFEHFSLLNGGHLKTEARCADGIVQVSVSTFRYQRTFNLSTSMSAAEYLNDWRMLMHELIAQINHE